jgi:hypothetical protein
MKISRRKFIGTGAIGLTSVATLNSAQPGGINKPVELCDPNAKPFVFGKEPNRVRKSFYDLTDEEVRTLCKAVDYMRNTLPMGTPTQWESYANIHMKHCTASDAANPQVHWGWHFLPWHRGYIFFLERILANCLDKLGYNGVPFAYPFWDWCAHQEIPNTKEREARGLASPLFGYDLTQENMVNADNLGFDNIALFDGNRGPTIQKSKMDPNNEVSQDSKAHVQECKNYMSPEYINLVLTTPWEQFGGKPVTDRATGQGLVESGPHNDGHDWVGTRYGKNRNMGTLRYAANDPIFFMHHGNIDRIFSLYRNPMPDLDGPWGQQVYTFPDIDGSPVTVTIKDIMTKMNTVSYAVPSDNNLTVPTSVSTNYASVSAPINQYATVREGLSLYVRPQNTLKDLISKAIDGGTSLLEIETGPVFHVGKCAIKAYVNGKYIGRVKIMDGDPSTTNKTITHSFTMTVGHLGKMKEVIPNGDKFELQLKLVNFKNDVLIRNLKLSVIG